MKAFSISCGFIECLQSYKCIFVLDIQDHTVIKIRITV